MDGGTRRRWRRLGRITLAGLLIGAPYGFFVNEGELSGALRGAVTGVAIAGPLFAFEGFVIEGPAGASLRRLSFLRLFAVKSALYLAFIMLGEAIGVFLVPTKFGRLLPLDDRLLWSTLFSAGAAITINFILQIDRMLGQGELWRFVLGRYHQPRREE